METLNIRIERNGEGEETLTDLEISRYLRQFPIDLIYSAAVDTLHLSAEHEDYGIAFYRPVGTGRAIHFLTS